MAPYIVKEGLDIPLDGAPRPEVDDRLETPSVCLYPQEFPGVKPRLKVKEGDRVRRGSPLFFDKRRPHLHFCAPIGGVVKTIEYGARRAIMRIVIDPVDVKEAESFTTYEPARLSSLARDEVLSHLLRTGYLAFIKERPFSGIAHPDTQPKAIFVNGMNTAPFQADLHVVVKGQETAFQAGLDVLTCLTEGKVYLSLADGSPLVSQFKNVSVHTFKGPHPSGNTSVHIQRIEPMDIHDKVWTIRAVDLIQIGRLFLEGRLPDSRIIALAGPGVKPDARKYYRVRPGSSLAPLLDGRLTDGEQRVLSGDVLGGTQIDADGHIPFFASAINVLAEGRERFFLGWLAPGINRYSRSHALLSGWFGLKRKWNLTTSLNGSKRSMVLTGLYDRYVPLNIMVDYLVRAVLANDTDEAIRLGILETEPEDFALCSFVCPSKMDICGVIRKGLKDIEVEGI